MNVWSVITLMRFIVISRWFAIWAIFSRPTLPFPYLPRLATVGNIFLSA